MAKIVLKPEFNNNEPVYTQLVRYYRTLVATGRIIEGDELPSRRELAINLVINPNTVQRAYSMLEEQGYIKTANNSKSVAIVNAQLIEESKNRLINEYVKDFNKNIKSIVKSNDEILELLKKYWEKGEI